MQIEEAKKYCKQIKDRDLCKVGYVYGSEAIETVLNELEKKDKVIDLMAEYIHNTSNGEIYDIVCKEECENRNCIFAIGDNKEQEIDCIKQYFYKKASEEKC